MREVNFSIPNVNKASVGITTALYDRRALDCTSTLPLINSLNHLAYLTTSSARIRDILCVDGGVERLVCILKQGRSKEMMEMWKWNLAFQCVVNIGVRGSENVRTRVVEADMVPVIATLLDNYIQVIDHCREKAAEPDGRRVNRFPCSRPASRSFRENSTRSPGHERGSASADFHTRRQPPPSINIPQHGSQPNSIDGALEASMNPPSLAIVSPPEPSPFPRQATLPRQSNPQSPPGRPLPTRNGLQPPTALIVSTDGGEAGGLRPVRDTERLPSMLPSSQGGVASQPESPTTPSAPITQSRASTSDQQMRDALRRQPLSSASGDSDDGSTDVNVDNEATVIPDANEQTMVDINPAVNIENDDDAQTILEAVATPMDLSVEPGSEGQEATAFNITHRTGLDGSIITTNLTPPPDGPTTIGQRQAPPPMQPMSAPSPQINYQLQGRYMIDRSAPPALLAATPRDEDVLMSLQLLAYVSKYCNLRTYFQHSHLVPRLKIEKHLKLLNEGGAGTTSPGASAVEESNECEYLLPDDYNIFPLVEKFTVRHHSQDMQYWAGVVMRNLCRKDDSKGGIRQCAYYKCGKWEEWTRQFAKCRRCRRTKYCSKECQKNAWVYHRHWCQMATS